MISPRPVQNGRQSLFSFAVVGVVCLALAPVARPQANSSGPAAGAPPASSSTPREAAPPSTPPPSAPPAAAVPSAPLPPLAGALDLLRDGKLDEAADAYHEIAASGTGTDVPAAFAGLARVYLKQKDISGAYTAAAKAVEFGPSFPDAHVALGEVYFREAKLAEAEKEWINVINSGHPAARAYLGLYRISHATSNYKSAKDRLDRAHQLDPDDPEITRLWILTQVRQDRASHLEIPSENAKQLFGACELASKADSTEIKLERLGQDSKSFRAYGLDVKLNGVPAHLMVDTGAHGILIDRRIAEKAGVTRIVDAKTGGIGDAGDVAGYIAAAKTIQIGSLEFHDCAVDVYGKRSVQGDDGLIGAHVFESFLVDLDFPDAKLRLSQLPAIPSTTPGPATLQTHTTETAALHDRYIAPEMKSYTRIYRFGHMLLIPTSLNDSPPRLFLIDTGGWDNMVTPQLARETTKVRHDEYDRVTGLSGNVKNLYTVDHAKIRFAQFQQEREDLTSFDMTSMSNSAGTEISGSLGFVMLWLLDIKIDYRDGLVDFTYDANRFH
jgi:tetratricopeptide (TPR) repeat protein